MIASAFFVDQAFEATEFRRSSKHSSEYAESAQTLIFVFGIQPAWKYLAVVYIDRIDSMSADKCMIDIDVYAVLVTVVTEAVLFVQRVSKSLCCK